MITDADYKVVIRDEGNATPAALAGALELLRSQGVPDTAMLLLNQHNGSGWALIARWQPETPS